MKNEEKKVYEHLKHNLLETNYLGNSLVEKAFLYKSNDPNYTKKVKAAEPYLLERISQGDTIAYALYYTEHESELKKIEEESLYNNLDDFINFIQNTPMTSEQTNDSFFDYKIEYVSQFLGDLIDC